MFKRVWRLNQRALKRVAVKSKQDKEVLAGECQLKPLGGLDFQQLL
jgi:hypothetical protein